MIPRPHRATSAGSAAPRASRAQRPEVRLTQAQLADALGDAARQPFHPGKAHPRQAPTHQTLALVRLVFRVAPVY